MVKCADCGFLAQRHVETRELRDAEESLRKSGKIPLDWGDHLYRPLSDPAPPVYESPPLCAELQIEFPEKNAFEAIQEERECPAFMKWHPGFLPKEHREMLDRERMLQWQRDRENEDRRWRDEQRKEERRWRLIELVVLGGFVTFVLVMAQIVAAFIQR